VSRPIDELADAPATSSPPQPATDATTISEPHDLVPNQRMLDSFERERPVALVLFYANNSYFTILIIRLARNRASRSNNP
jgi:hypothetical protein